MHSMYFHGHACISLLGEDYHLLIDPFRAGDFEGVVDLHPVVGSFTHVASTHDHADHAHFGAAPLAHRCRGGGNDTAPFSLRRVPVWHDLHEGRLRGGLGGSLVVESAGVTVIHLGDVGEPATAAAAAAFPPAADLLVVPCGGYYTLGANEALDWIRMLRPRRALLCHARDQGVRLPQLAMSSECAVRMPGFPWRSVTWLELSEAPVSGSATEIFIARAPGICATPAPRISSAVNHDGCVRAISPGFDMACCGT
jgi:L-ascorbate metabolism protein UlaG (beta-lactamase superfamily)